MNFSRKSIESIITGKNQAPILVNIVLTLLSEIYGAVVRLRRKGYATGFLKSKTLPCAVISIGNLTIGGTGKTPMTIYLAERLKQMGYRVAVISRGYKGSAEKHGGIVSDGKTILMDPETAGDEPFLLAASLKGIPVLVGRDRCRSGRQAVKRFQAQVVILDDAFQHLPLYRDLNLLLLDRTHPFGNGCLLPRGTLREPASALNYSDALILTRSSKPFRIPADSWAKGRPVFFAVHEPFFSAEFSAGERLQFQSHTPINEDQRFMGKHFFAFSGIADNHDFQRTLQKMGVDVCGAKEFPDHHNYSADDIQTILEAAVDSGATTLATTEKDMARLHGRFQFPMECVVVGIRISIDDSTVFDRLIQNRISFSS
jgi:tetraacyldisaccharide 4'-kinase